MSALLSGFRSFRRLFVKRPWFVFVVVATLALSIGVNTSVFSITWALMVRPIDLPDLDRVVTVRETTRAQGHKDVLSAGALFDLAAQAQSFQALAGYQRADVNVMGGDGPEIATAVFVSDAFFDAVGGRPAVGRTFSGAADDATTVLLSDQFWRRRFAADPAAIGRSLSIDGKRYTVIGVMPPSFRFPQRFADFYAPLDLKPEERADWGMRVLRTVGKLKPGHSPDEANAELALLARRQASEHPAENVERTLSLVPIAEGVVSDQYRHFLWALLAAAALVLLVACANLANLQIARAADRSHEMMVRVALGATRAQIIGQLIVESCLFALTGAAAAVPVAYWAVDLVRGALPAEVTRDIAGWDRMNVNLPALALTLAVSLFVGLVVGLAPALQLGRTNVGEALKSDSRGATGSRQSQRLRATLVVVQLTLALALVIGAGALTRGFITVANPNRGLVSANVMTAQLALPDERYPTDQHAVDFAKRLVDKLTALPGVKGAAVVNNIPWGHPGTMQISVENADNPALGTVNVDDRAMTPGYLALLEVPLLRGRVIAESDDRADAPAVALVSERTARILWPGRDALGHRFKFGAADAKAPWFTVVGVVGDVYHRALEPQPALTVYVPFAQDAYKYHYVVVRTARDPNAIVHAMRASVTSIDPELPLYGVRQLDDVLFERVSGLRLASGLMAVFAALALLLGALGVNGVMSYLVTQRTREIGIRIAIGAQPRVVLAWIFAKGMRLALIGAALGFAAGMLLVRVGESSLGAIVAVDGLIYAGATASVLVTAALGIWLPARRAARIPAALALREE